MSYSYDFSLPPPRPEPPFSVDVWLSGRHIAGLEFEFDDFRREVGHSFKMMYLDDASVYRSYIHICLGGVRRAAANPAKLADQSSEAFACFASDVLRSVAGFATASGSVEENMARCGVENLSSPHRVVRAKC